MIDTKKFSYVVLAGALAFLAYAVHDTRVRTDATGEGPRAGGQRSARAVPNPNWEPNETVTGNILAADFAQDQRDWALANKYLNLLGGAVADDPATTLRMMLLAVSSGQFDRAGGYARRILERPAAVEAAPAGQSGAAVANDGRDLAALVLLAGDVRAGRLDEAAAHMAQLRNSALSMFVLPVIGDWLRAASKKPLEADMTGLPLLQMVHRGLAAEWGAQKAVADRIFGALAQMPLNPATAVMVASYDVRGGNNQAARALLETVARKYPHDADVNDMLAALAAGHTPAMRPELSYHMQGVSAGVAMAFRDLAQMMLADKADDSALVFAQIGRLVRSDVPGLSLLVGGVFYQQGRFDDAAGVFASVQPDESDYADAQIHLAELRAEQGDNPAAIRILEAVMAQRPAPRVAYALGEVYRTEGDNEKAVAAYDRAVAAAGSADDASLWSVYFVRAMALDDLGRWDKAEADLKKALALRPDDPHLLNYLGYSWADRNVNLVQARGMLLAALASAPADPYITDSLGWLYFRQGNLRDATLLLERAVSLKPYDPVLNDHLGDAYEKAGRGLEARYQWARALDYANAGKDAKLITAIKEKLAVRKE